MGLISRVSGRTYRGHNFLTPGIYLKMTRWARPAVGMIVACTIISPFGKSIKHEAETPGLDESTILRTLVSFNHFFVKYIWFWTWCTILPFATAFALKIQNHSSFSFKKRSKASVNYLKLLQPLIRIGIFGTIVWLAFTSLKRVLYENSGRCVVQNTSKVILKATTPKLCKWFGNLDGAKWTGFNLSGHCFMLNFCTLIVLNEIEEYIYMRKRINNDALKIMYWFCLVFVGACQAMVLVTYCMYHRPLEKIMATLLAVICWQILYEEVFKRRVISSKLVAPPIKEKMA